MFVLPSFLENVDQTSFDKKFFSNVTLKIGQIMRINYPDTSNDQASKVTTYDIFINESSLDGTAHSVIYGAIASNMFGGLADYVDYTFRANVSPDEGEESEQLLLSGAPITKDDYPKILGCTVIVACVNGSPSDSVIIGAIPHFLNSIVNEETYKVPTKEDGHFLNFVFNGIKVNINKDGELTLSRLGPTTSDGALDTDLSSEDKSGSTIKIDKEGAILVSAGTNADDSDDEVKPQLKLEKDGAVTILSENINFGAAGLGDSAAVAIASKTLDELNKIKKYLQALHVILTGPPINEVGMGAPSVLQAALQVSIQSFGGLPNLETPACKTTKVK